MKGSKLPTVVLVGRMNVGKSTLFNRLSVNVKSITFNYEGVTRDFLKDTVCWKNSCFELIDTGGIGLQKEDDSLREKARQRVLEVIEFANVLLFVCDGKEGLTKQDQEIAKFIRSLNKKVLLVVNKSDVALAQEQLYDFYQLGFKELCAVSAQHGKGIPELFDAILDILPREVNAYTEPEPTCKIVLLGKPNVGKSSLMNLLLQQERSIISDVPGTTREAISEYIRFYQEDILVTDTPGVRRPSAIKEPLEGLMVKSALHALKETHIVLLLIDINQGKIADQELKLAFYAFENQYKAVILLFNKEDLLTDVYVKQQIESSLKEYAYFLKKIEFLYISCKSGKNVGKVLPLVKEVWERYSQRLSDEEVNRIFKEAIAKRPMYHKTIPLLLYKARQIHTTPITILLQVNHPTWFGDSQLGFFENVLRKHYNLKSTPIKFMVRKRGK